MLVRIGAKVVAGALVGLGLTPYQAAMDPADLAITLFMVRIRLLSL